MNVLVILAHPRKNSFCGALANEYIKGAEESGAFVKVLHLIDMQFEMNVFVSSPEKQYLEPDILMAKELISWADHLVFVYPTWWGNVPALLKAFLDRTMMPGFAFREIQYDTFDKMLKPKTAQLITTMDTPLFVYKLIYGSPGTKALVNATLKFCGISPVRKMYLSPVKHSNQNQKNGWLHKAYLQGRKLQYGILTGTEKFCYRLMPWIKAIRLQFYPMTFMAYGAGSFAAHYMGHHFNLLLFLIGYLYLFLFEVAVVFNNDYYDYESDVRNKNFSPFSGGSRVLVEKLIPLEKFKRAINRLLIACGIIFIIIIFLSTTSASILIPLIVLLSFLAWFYTAPPIKLSHKGFGEVTVCFTHSFAIILCGYVFQGGHLLDALPYYISIPLFFSIFPAIIMSGMPDYDADKEVGKETLVVKLGKERATMLAIVCVIIAVVSAIFLKLSGILNAIYGNEIYIVILHAAILISMLYKFMNKKNKPNRIDGIMTVALMFILWFVLIPFIRLL